jgi:hypothetical protein
MKTIKKKSQQQEKSTAKLFNARVVVASGAKWNAKGDVRNSKFLIECKTTGKKYFSVTAKIWEKIAEEALRDHMRIPLLAIDLEYCGSRLIVFRLKDFDRSVHPQFPNPAIGVQKSFRVTMSPFWDECKTFVPFTICGESINELCCMNLPDFLNEFKEEF